MGNTYINHGDYYTGITSRGHEFYFDADSFDVVKQYNWKIGRDKYVMSGKRGSEIILKNLLYGSEPLSYLDGNIANLRKDNVIPFRGSRNAGKSTIGDYVALYMPEDERAYKSNGCICEHRLVAEKMLGRPLKDGECVHHKDFNKKNNDPENLMVFSTRRDHAVFHKGGSVYLTEDGSYKTIRKSPSKKEKTKNTKERTRKKSEDDYTAKICPMCNGPKNPKSKICVSCYKKNQAIKVPPKEELEPLIYKLPFVQIAKRYGVTDNAVRKWCKKYNLPYKKEGFKRE